MLLLFVLPFRTGSCSVLSTANVGEYARTKGLLSAMTVASIAALLLHASAKVLCAKPSALTHLSGSWVPVQHNRPSRLSLLALLLLLSGLVAPVVVVVRLAITVGIVAISLL